MSFVEIKIKNWNKYNPRKDYKRVWWFAFSNTFLEDSDFYSFSDQELRAWIYILSQASKQQKDTPRLDFEHAFRVCKIKPASLSSCIEKLKRLHVVTGICTDSVRDLYEIKPLQNITEHNITEQNTYVQTGVRTSVSFDFENLYASYPRKQGKSLGMKKLQSTIKTPEDFEKAKQAIEKYTNHCKENAIDKQYIKMFSTFVGEWRDWLDPDIGTAVAMKKKTGLESFMERFEDGNSAK